MQNIDGAVLQFQNFVFFVSACVCCWFISGVGNLPAARTFEMARIRIMFPKLQHNTSTKRNSMISRHVDSKSVSLGP